MEHYDFDLGKFHAAYHGFLERAKVRVIDADDEFLGDLKMDFIKLNRSDITELKMVLRNYEPYTSFNLKNLGKFEAYGMGEHIAIDASLAILAANCEIGLEEIREKLKNYKGIKKRFDILVANDKFALIDDYGHHPTEIAATLKSAHEYARLLGLERVTAIFQPHRYTRLKANLEGFKKCFEGTVDELIVLPVWSAGEDEIEIDLKAAFPNAFFAERVNRVGDVIEFTDDFGVKHVQNSGLLIGFGAGDISYQLRGIV